ncbi:hypothetical protein HB912_06025 [Listeria aquatica]|uniref:Uncharacterized protein n=1 Tax=Listeria aquatica TaxID=1494960 RepID=A0A841ZNU5_9LIST|nr:hypothetical protein [Listeria aquatica]MBC1521197.1 hypothetical protein [Listeria aquatica]
MKDKLAIVFRKFGHEKSAESSATLKVGYGQSLILTCYVILNNSNNLILTNLIFFGNRNVEQISR